MPKNTNLQLLLYFLFNQKKSLKDKKANSILLNVLLF